MKLIRRLSCVLLLITLFTFASQPATAAAKQYLVYVGTYTNRESKGIYAYRYDATSGQMTPLGLVGEAANPSFLVADTSGRHLYSANETDSFQGQSSGSVSAFAIDAKTGKLSLLNEVPSRGASPCYIALDRSGKFVLVANYTGGNAAVFPILADGKLGDSSAFVQDEGTGPDKERQEKAHAHWMETSPDNSRALIVDLGADKVFIYRFDPQKGTLQPNQPPFAQLKPGSGPRHLAFHRNGKLAYVINELNSSVTTFSYDRKTGGFAELQSLSTLPADFSRENSTAEIAVHPNGKFLYGSNRGHNSIAVFSIDAKKGTLTPVEQTPTQGRTPRNFQIDPTGTRLFVANQDSDNIVVFAIDAATGRLTPTGQELKVSAPVCIKFVAAN